MDSGFHVCGFRIPHPWIPDSISGWIPDFKILFSGVQRFFCTLFSLKTLVLFLPEVVVVKNIILGLTQIVNIGAFPKLSESA